MQETEKIWMNGELVDWADARVHVGVHGLHYGTGVFEGIRCYDTPRGPAVFRLRDHLQRLDDSARLLYMDLPYSVDELRAATLNDQTRAGVGAAAVRLRGLPLTFLPLAGDDFETVFERLDPLRQVGLVVVDYLQLVPPPRERTTQDEDTALVLRHLKALALNRQVALLLVAQLPGFNAARDDQRPTLNDYGVLGAPKQHADVVLSIFREEMYNPGGGVDGATELLVSKNRNGPTGFVDLYFYRRWMRFEDMLDPER
jgi:replicative DNA helicase